MNFVGRSPELGALRQLLDRREPQVVRIVGLPGVGKSRLVRRVAADYDGLCFTCPPEPDPAVRAALARRLAAVTRPEVPVTEHEAASWAELAGDMLAAAGAAERPWVLVLDDAHRLSDARARFARPLLDALAGAAAEGVAFHLVLVGSASRIPELAEPDAEDASRAEGVLGTTLTLGPLPFRAAASLLPRTDPHARLRAYGVFGGIPRVLAQLDTDVTVGTNVRRLLLSRDGPLADAPLAWLERDIQTPSRYVAVLRTLARGPAEWGAIHDGVPDLTRSGQLAPYLARLTRHGMLKSYASLDARPRSRSTRYALTDPFLAFWLRFVLPWRSSEASQEVEPPLREHYARRVRPAIDDHMAHVLPFVARQHMAHDALETLGAGAREHGGLWGPGYDIPAAGILTSGAAYYGTPVWTPPARQDSPLDALDRQIRETRYGFGRERRLRLVFCGRPAPTWLRREAARRPDAQLIEADDLQGS